MRRATTLTGTSKLRTARADLGAVTYRLDAWEEANGMKQANGSLTGPDAIVMKASFSNERLFLDLQTGGHVSIVMTGLGAFQVSGPVPGF